ncbi:MAG: hypothetical protein ACI4P0_02865 [Mailhella sp.]
MAEAVKVGREGSALSLISDWDTLGAALQVRPQILAYALSHREELARRITLKKGRVVFKSSPSLQFIQLRIAMLASRLVEELPEKEVILAYRKGVQPVQEISGYAGCHTLITTDVRKFFPSITLQHIAFSLEKSGMTKAGAKLVGRYGIARYTKEVPCEAIENAELGENAVLVLKGGRRVTASSMGAHLEKWRNGTVHAVRSYHALQQGSPASSALSNLVGYYYIDEKILAYLRGLGVYDNGDVAYRRYCDNIALFCRRDMGPEFYQNFRRFLTEEMKKSGFSLHSWNSIRNNARNRNQAFLGVVLNHDARVEKGMIDSLRAIFLNTCMHGFASQYARFLEVQGGETRMHASRFVLAGESAGETRMHGILRGKISYVGSVNKTHGAWLTKLYNAAVKIDAYVKGAIGHEEKLRRLQRRESKEMFSLLKLYRKKEGLSEYLERIDAFIAA